jgi:hypothetical protein
MYPPPHVTDVRAVTTAIRTGKSTGLTNTLLVPSPSDHATVNLTSILTPSSGLTAIPCPAYRS